MFQDGPIAQAVDYVASKGVAYFSSAGNFPGVDAYDAQFNRVPFDPANPQAALKGTNINLSGVDPSLYAGGFHNFRTDGGQDIAQQCGPVGPPGQAVIDFQWNDPYAYTKQSIGKLLLNEKGQLPSPASSITYSFQTTSDNELVRLEAGPVQTSGPDVTVAIFDSQGKLLLTTPDYRLPAELGLPASGSYSVVVSADSPVVGEFYVKINQVNITPSPEVTSNFNLLLFDISGTFVTSLSGDALATKQPILLQAFIYPFNFQLVIARSNIPTAPHPADRIRYLAVGFEALNYGSFLTPTSFGHNCADGANGVAAYSAFRPFAPEPYTSPGPATIYFDTNNNRLSTPEVRQRLILPVWTARTQPFSHQVALLPRTPAVSRTSLGLAQLLPMLGELLRWFYRHTEDLDPLPQTRCAMYYNEAHSRIPSHHTTPLGEPKEAEGL